uniref:Galactosyltransferase N-terminal domain-containing protein n=1 Tax=Ditylenchus dipsaci TaxID=166011 RepID=A0A915D2D4_9BILA
MLCRISRAFKCAIISSRYKQDSWRIDITGSQNPLTIVHHQIIVLNQTDEFRFNRASLINVGWFEADRLNCDFMCMHDVDLLPLNPHLNYSYPGKGIIKHISSGEYHPIKRYDYKKFIGGVLMLTIEDYRMVDANLRNSIVRPTNLTTDRSNTFMHIHPKSRKRDYSKTKNQKQMSRKRDRLTGLHSVRYKIKDRSFLHFGSTNASVLHIDLECDLERTPFCLLKSQSQ